MASHTSLPPDVLDALQRGQKLEAIERLRRARQLGLTQAKQLVDAHLRNLPPTLDASSAREPLPPVVLEALQQGRTLAAIKLLRRHSGVDLKEAKRAIDAIQRSASPLSPGEVPRAGVALRWIAVLAAGALAGYYWLHRLG